jgi:hypothetical protein
MKFSRFSRFAALAAAVATCAATTALASVDLGTFSESGTSSTGDPISASAHFVDLGGAVGPKHGDLHPEVFGHDQLY